VVLTVLNCVLTRYGAGRHAALVTLADQQKLSFIGTVCRFLYTACLSTTKVGICALYLRLFVERKDRMVVWMMVAYHAIVTIVLFFLLVLLCSPFEGMCSTNATTPCSIYQTNSSANWIFTEGSCQPLAKSLYTSAILNMIGDIALLAFIIPKLCTYTSPILLLPS
jgi:hypothetical protein